jgi:hypothetical protein
MRLFLVEKEWGCDPETRRPNVPEKERYMAITKSEAGIGVHFRGDAEGDPPQLVLPVSKGLQAPFTENEELHTLLLKAARVTGKQDEQKQLSPPSQAELDKLARGQYYGPCLVHVSLPIPEGGKLWFMANTSHEFSQEVGRIKRTERKYDAFNEAVNVEPLYMNAAGTEALLTIWPGSSFRIHRDEETLPKGESPVLVVTFNGRDLGCIRPRKYQRRGKRREKKRNGPDVVSQAYGQAES